MQLSEEDKNLLLRDLCGRTPYGVIIRVHIEGDNCCKGGDYNAVLDCVHVWGSVEFDYYDDLLGRSRWGLDSIENVKPYLRKLNSITEEEFEKLKEYSGLKYEQLDLASYQNGTYKCLDFYLSEVPSYVVILVFDWLNAHYFDYRGFIEKGLALEAPEGMYNTKE